MGPAARTNTVAVKLSDHEMKTLDELRGSLSRSAYFRSLMGRPVDRTPLPQQVAPQVATSSVTDDVAKRHWHKFEKDAASLHYGPKGVKMYLWRCACGAEKEA